ncbi:MAG: deoxyribodipyrimidine photo-lyase [Verrucomicrobiaceae bacterium]|nr:MAG: deoxyribodipyrimidine photo-lyase [Verrucomicrobiaceae bacterium]
MPKSHSRVIHWFRRDLRLTDNPALYAAAQAADQVVPVYVISSWRKDHHWTGAPRQEWLAGCLDSLEKNVAAVGGRLIFRRGEALKELEKLIRETKAEAIFYNRDPDPHGIRTEAGLEKLAQQLGIRAHGFQNATLHERDEILTAAGKPYRNNWSNLEKPAMVPTVTGLVTPPGLASEGAPSLKDWDLKPSGISMPEPGERAARRRMKKAVEEVLPHYAETRDTPLGHTTSRLSQDLRMGTLSIRELYHRASEAGRESDSSAVKKSVSTFISELAWRDFYMQILWHWPEVLEHEFDPQWRGLAWSYDEGDFERWKEGMTGFPLVDAGMRELKATGLMHNRLRMVTAMFLTKDLRIDWRLGERWFSQALIDAEIASNNGGWQWSAGTGADAAPYFRIQNPWSQTRTHDPAGEYIRHWVPELKKAPLAALLNPPAEGRSAVPGTDYPAPMVDHKAAREATLEMFKKHRARHQGQH